jgi:hypothetical protein
VARVLPRAEIAAALADRAAERDQVQQNLLDLDASFGKRLLAGAALAGVTKARWEGAATELAAVWQTFTAYSAVVQRAGEVFDGTRRTGGPLLGAMTALLTGPSVELSGEDVPVARRQLTGSGQPTEHLTLEAVVQRMTTAFARVADVVGAAEAVWTEVSGRLDQLAAIIAPATQLAAALNDEALTSKLGTIDAELRRMRDLLNSDPLTLWQDGAVVTAGLDQLMPQAQSAAALAGEMSRLQADAVRRLAAAARAVAVARACEQDALAVRNEVADKIAAPRLPPQPAATGGLGDMLADLDTLRLAGQWRRLASALDAIDRDAAAAAARWNDAGQAARALLDRRGELRGLLDAYRAKAGRRGGAEDAELTSSYAHARELLWSAPCDLTAAADAVRSYQEGVLALQEGTS